MVRSIEFTGEKGFVGAKYTEKDKPVKPSKKDPHYYKGFFNDKTFDEEKYNADYAEYRSALTEWRKNNGKYKVDCSETLLGRKFEFSQDKVNIIFGPNASGKTTIIKSIGGHALTEDGWASFVKPLDYRLPMQHHEKEDFKKKLADVIRGYSNADTVIDWDGSPIYYHGFENRKNYGSIGDLTGSILSDTLDEIQYIMAKGRMSGAENTIYQLMKLLESITKKMTYKPILDRWKKEYYIDRSRGSDDPWMICYEVMEEYFTSMPNALNPDASNTFLFDEIDKSMDINNVITLYNEVLPGMVKKYNQQIIAVSHSPIILTDKIFNSEKYNIISMDPSYTETSRNNLKQLFE